MSETGWTPQREFNKCLKKRTFLYWALKTACFTTIALSLSLLVEEKQECGGGDQRSTTVVAPWWCITNNTTTSPPSHAAGGSVFCRGASWKLNKWCNCVYMKSFSTKYSGNFLIFNNKRTRSELVQVPLYLAAVTLFSNANVAVKSSWILNSSKIVFATCTLPVQPCDVIGVISV